MQLGMEMEGSFLSQWNRGNPELCATCGGGILLRGGEWV